MKCKLLSEAFRSCSVLTHDTLKFSNSLCSLTWYNLKDPKSNISYLLITTMAQVLKCVYICVHMHACVCLPMCVFAHYNNLWGVPLTVPLFPLSLYIASSGSLDNRGGALPIFWCQTMLYIHGDHSRGRHWSNSVPRFSSLYCFLQAHVFKSFSELQFSLSLRGSWHLKSLLVYSEYN